MPIGCPPFRVTPASPQWGDLLALETTAIGGFGVVEEATVWLLGGTTSVSPDYERYLTPDISSTTQKISVTLPSQAPSSAPTWWIRAPRANCTPVLLPGLTGNGGVCPVYTASLPAQWGKDLTLSATVGSFGSPPGGPVYLRGATGGTKNLTVSSWSSTRIVVKLPDNAPFPGPYTTSVRVGTSDCEMPSTFAIELPAIVKELHLIKLVCNETESTWPRADNCYLKIRGYPTPASEIRVPSEGEWDMNKDDEWLLGYSYGGGGMPLANPITIELWEADVDPDDLLGRAEITPLHALSPEEGSIRKFTGDGSDYDFHYKVARRL